METYRTTHDSKQISELGERFKRLIFWEGFNTATLTIVPVLQIAKAQVPCAEWARLIGDLMMGLGIDINMQDRYGQTALAFVIRSFTVNYNTFEFYVRHGADPNITDFNGHSAWTYLFNMLMFPTLPWFLLVLRHGAYPMIPWRDKPHEKWPKQFGFEHWSQTGQTRKILDTRRKIFIMCVPCVLPQYRTRFYLPMDYVRKLGEFLI